MRPTAAARWFVTVLSICLSAAGVVRADSIVGEWTLVEQTYGNSKSNLVEAEPEPLSLELYRLAGRIEGRLRTGDRSGAGLSWPRLVEDDARTTCLEEKVVSAAEDRIRVRYRVDPPPGDDLVLEVIEEYALEGANALAGTVRVRFERAGESGLLRPAPARSPTSTSH